MNCARLAGKLKANINNMHNPEQDNRNKTELATWVKAPDLFAAWKKLEWNNFEPTKLSTKNKADLENIGFELIPSFLPEKKGKVIPKIGDLQLLMNFLNDSVPSEKVISPEGVTFLEDLLEIHKQELLDVTSHNVSFEFDFDKRNEIEQIIDVYTKKIDPHNTYGLLEKTKELQKLFEGNNEDMESSVETDPLNDLLTKLEKEQPN